MGKMILYQSNTKVKALYIISKMFQFVVAMVTKRHTLLGYSILQQSFLIKQQDYLYNIWKRWGKTDAGQRVVC